MTNGRLGRDLTVFGILNLAAGASGGAACRWIFPWIAGQSSEAPRVGTAWVAGLTCLILLGLGILFWRLMLGRLGRLTELGATLASLGTAPPAVRA